MTTIRKVFCVDLKDDADLIARYKAWHAAGAVPAAVTKAIRGDDIRALDIYCFGNRLVMIMEQGPGFDPAAKSDRDADNPDVVAWDALMRTFQQPVPGAPREGTWAEMDSIYSLADQPI